MHLKGRRCFIMGSLSLTCIAEWLDTFFAGYDHALLSELHSLAEWGGSALTIVMRVITFAGEKGILMFALALILMLFRKTRRCGICIFGAVCCGALITNIILKDSVERLRPLEALAEYTEWWQFVGAPAEDGFSFPSGHVTALTSGLCALCFCRGKKYILPTVISVVIMGISRNYLMAHYPSDVLAAMIIGIASAAAAYGITVLIYRLIDRYRDRSFFRFVLDADIGDLFRKKGAVD